MRSVTHLWTAAACAALVLLAGSAYWAGETARAGPNLATCLARSAQAAGVVIPIHRESRVVGPAPDGVLVEERGLGARARVTGIAEPVGPGVSISILGRFQPPDRVEALAYHIHRARYAKVWVSLPPLFWLVFVLVRAWRLGPAGLEERA